MKTEEAIRIGELITKHKEHCITPQETEQLSQWVNESEEHRKLFGKLSESHFFANKYQEETTDYLPAYQHFIDRIHQSGSVNHLKKFYLITTAAAVIALFLTATLFLSRTTGKDETPYANTPSVIAPGCSQAILTLADGQKVYLQGEINDKIVQKDGTITETRGNRIEYHQAMAPAGQVSYNRLDIPRKGEFHLLLSDGTRVWLNSETVIEYPASFPRNERRVRLKGEAYFKVSPDPESPFIIETGHSEVQVLGTSFNLCAYEEETNIYVTLAEGSVCLSSDGHSVRLSPNEQGIINRNTGALSVRTVDTSLYMGWKDGRFIFENQNLEEIMNTLARWYDLRVIFTTQAARNINFTGNLKRYDNFSQIVKMLETASEAKFSISENTIYITN